MDGSADPRRDFWNSLPMSLPPPTAGQSQQPQQPQQRVFFRSTGKTISESRLQQMFIEMTTTVKQGGKIAKATHHENLWMLSQHHPTHPLLKGKHVPPPENTSPALLEEMYSKKEVQVFKEYYERQRAKAGPSNVASQPQYQQPINATPGPSNIALSAFHNLATQSNVSSRPQYTPQAQAQSASGAYQVIFSRKRKEPPTAPQQPIPKRQYIDLTIDEAPSALHIHATQSNVSSPPQYTPQALPQSAPSIHTFEPDPSVAAAREKVKSGKYDFSWSEENEELSRPPSDGELSRMGCTREKDGWRAPSPEGLTQERADLEWAMQNV
jgi:hypothetical protein